MFLISDDQADLISETVNQNRSVFREEILEKDLVISKVLELVSKLSTSPLQLAFGGGTSLVKARGLMDRLSEDVDIKVITPEELTRSTLRSAMRAIRSEFQKILESNGFVGIQVEARLAGRFSIFSIPYQSRFESGLPFDSSIKLEFFAQIALAPTTPMPILSLAHALNELAEPTQIREIIALEETLAQKVVAFLSRVDRVGKQPKLMRHLYDVWRVRELETNKSLMQNIFDFSIDELHQRTRGFSDPESGFEILKARLGDLRSTPGLQAAFTLQLAAIASAPPSFEAALAEFEILAASLFAGSSYAHLGQ
jgi:predicted nucleotidyltransferase component of viral defense system